MIRGRHSFLMLLTGPHLLHGSKIEMARCSLRTVYVTAAWALSTTFCFTGSTARRWATFTPSRLSYGSVSDVRMQGIQEKHTQICAGLSVLVLVVAIRVDPLSGDVPASFCCEQVHACPPCDHAKFATFKRPLTTFGICKCTSE